MTHSPLIQLRPLLPTRRDGQRRNVDKPVGLYSSEESTDVAVSNSAAVSCSGSGDEEVGGRIHLTPLANSIAHGVRLVTV